MTVEVLINQIDQDKQQLIDLIKDLNNPTTTQKLKQIPDVIDKNLAFIKKFSQTTEWNEYIKKDIHRVGSVIEAQIGFIESSVNNHSNKNLLIGPLKNIYTSYQQLKDFLSYFPQKIEFWHDDRLRLEQQAVCKIEAVNEVLKEVLAKIEEKALENSWAVPNQCYISHSQTEDTLERWVQPFLEHLRGHLRQAGINTLLDMVDDPASGDPVQFMDQIKKADFVIIVGTKALFQQHILGEYFNQLALINQNRVQQQGKTLPILLSGQLENTLPANFLVYSNITDWRKCSYVVNLKKLLVSIYEIAPDNEEYFQLWREFEQKYPKLVEGFPESAIRYQLTLEIKDGSYQKELNSQQATQLFKGINENKFNQVLIESVNQENILTWEMLIDCVKVKYAQESKFKTVLGEAQEISSCYINLVIVEEKEKEKRLFRGIYNQKVEESKQLSKDQQLVQEEWLNSYEQIHGTKTSILPQDIHKPQEDKAFSRQLILGQAGIGKSTLCQYFAYQWAKEGWWKEEIFKLLVWIPLRKLLNETNYSKNGKEEITLGKVFYEQFKEQLQFEVPVGQSKHWIEALNALIKAHSSEILYVLDGFDEVAHICQLDAKEATHQTEILNQLLKQKRVVITSRPYYSDNYLAVQGIKIDRRLENIGLVNKDIQAYIECYPWEASQQQKTLQSSLNSNSLMRGIAHVPINLALLCRYWSTQTSKESNCNSMTDLYEGVIGDLLYESLAKQSGKGYIDFIIPIINDILDNKKVQFILQFLEKLAFLQMQEESLIISKERIADLLKEFGSKVEVNEWQEFKSVLGTSLLVSLDEQEKRFEERREHYFIHLTFQEFLAARYIAHLFKQNEESSREVALLEIRRLNQTINNQSLALFMQDHKYDLRYERVWWFVAGLLKEHREGIERFFNSLLSEPRDLSGWYDVLLWIKCLEESKLTNNLSRALKENLVEKIRKMAVVALDKSTYLARKEYSKKFFEYLYSSLMVYEKLNILQTQKAIRKASDVLKWHLNLPVSVLNRIVSLLRYKRSDTKCWAVEVLGNQSNLPDSAVNQVANLLSDDIGKVRSLALFALGKQLNLSDNVLNKMVKLLSDKNGSVRSAAQSALGQQPNLSDNVLSGMVRLLRDEERSVRSTALSALGQQPNLRVSILNEMVGLLNDEDWTVKSAALSALGQQPNLRLSVLNEMVKLLSDEDGTVRSSALEALGKQPNLRLSVLNEMVRLLSDKECIVRSSALKALGQQPNLRLSVLNEVVKLLSDKVCIVRSAVLEALGKQPNLSNNVLSGMVRLLRDEERGVRSAALYTLGQQPNLRASVLNEMVRLLRDEAENVRSLALYTLGQQSNLGVSILNEMVKLLSDKKWTVRSAVLFALGQQPNLRVSVLNKMVRLLSDKEETVRNSALKALGQQPNLPVGVLSLVITSINDKNQMYNISNEEIDFINQQLVPLLDNPNLQLSSMPKLLSNIMLNYTFSNKGVVYFKNDQLLVIQLRQQFKQIAIKDKNEFMQAFIQQRKFWINNQKIKFPQIVNSSPEFSLNREPQNDIQHTGISNSSVFIPSFLNQQNPIQPISISNSSVFVPSSSDQQNLIQPISISNSSVFIPSSSDQQNLIQPISISNSSAYISSYPAQQSHIQYPSVLNSPTFISSHSAPQSHIQYPNVLNSSAYISSYPAQQSYNQYPSVLNSPTFISSHSAPQSHIQYPSVLDSSAYISSYPAQQSHIQYPSVLGSSAYISSYPAQQNHIPYPSILDSSAYISSYPAQQSHIQYPSVLNSSAYIASYPAQQGHTQNTAALNSPVFNPPYQNQQENIQSTDALDLLAFASSHQAHIAYNNRKRKALD